MARETATRGVNVSVWATGSGADCEEARRHVTRVSTYEAHWPKLWFRSPSLVRGLSKAVHEIDLLHLHGVWTHVQQATARLARKRNVPYMITAHGVLFPWKIRSKGFKKRTYLSLIGRHMLTSSACLHAITSAEVEGFRHIGYDGPVTVVPNGVDVPQYHGFSLRDEAEVRWSVLKGRRVVLFLSRLSPEKGLDQLIPAFGDLVKCKAYDDTLLVLAGPVGGRYCSKVRALIEESGVQDSVVMVGFVQGHEKDLLMSRADVYTLPSYSEGFSISVLENLALGTPVLVTTGCNFPEVARVGAGLCCQPTRGDLADGLRELLDMPGDEAEKMGHRGRELVLNNYTWPVVAAKLLTVYDCILHGKPIPLYPEPRAVEEVQT
ncbi:MAG: glycosyltransferase [Sedimentisphaerales bacterium]|nr:glycosyltransferase [Sedimentisphaerales bacterium]